MANFMSCSSREKHGTAMGPGRSSWRLEEVGNREQEDAFVRHGSCTALNSACQRKSESWGRVHVAGVAGKGVWWD